MRMFTSDLDGPGGTVGYHPGYRPGYHPNVMDVSSYLRYQWDSECGKVKEVIPLLNKSSLKMLPNFPISESCLPASWWDMVGL